MMKLDEILVTRNWVGKPIRRKEDTRLVKGEAAYVDDLNMDCYQAAILRSPYAHARIKGIDLTKAQALQGVVAVLTGQEVARQTKPISARAITRPATQYVMAADKVRYVGEPVAAVVAEDRYIAEDALDLIEVEYEPLPPVVTLEDALKPDAPLVFEEAGSNVLMHDNMQHGDIEQAYREADLVLKESFKVHRYSSTPLEPWAIIANYERASDSFVVWSNDQQHGRSLTNVCNTLGIPIHKLRLIVPDIGGGFGIKLALWPYIVILSLLAKKASKPVKWIQTRREHLLAGTHAPDANVEIELALKKDGRILGLSIKDIQNGGSFVHTAGIYGLIKFATMVGCYTIKATKAELLSVVTNKAPTVQNRGVGKPTMIFVLERMVDIAAKKLGLDPVEIRLRNFVQPGQMPYTTPSGEIYESGDYPQCLKKALDLIGYEELKEKVAKGEGAVSPEKHRIAWLYVLPLFDLKIADWLEETLGAVIAVDSFGYATTGIELDPEDPLGFLVKKPLKRGFVCKGYAANEDLHFVEELTRVTEEYHADVAILLSHWSCQQYCGVIRLLRDAIGGKLGLPFYILNGDLMDPRVASSEQMKAG
ncbi:MAG: molybdopterin-dependent oxidoreductase, partial [Acidobacteria bacterium]|nr:molybdopterin-dependent oxidoreductase [Acidobacteriota bacterium]